MSKQTTSIDWLIEKYTIVLGLGSKELMKEHIERAIAMHKTEIIYAFQEGKCEGWENHELKINGKKYQSVDPAEYYKDKFA